LGLAPARRGAIMVEDGRRAASRKLLREPPVQHPWAPIVRPFNSLRIRR